MGHTFLHLEVQRQTIDVSVLTSHIIGGKLTPTESLGPMCLAQGHLDVGTGEARIQTTDPWIIEHLALPREPQLPHSQLAVLSVT